MARFLFTTLPTNDLGLLTRSLPIAEVLRERGHTIQFSCPGAVPSTLLAKAGFRNELPLHPIFDVFAAGSTPRGVAHVLLSGKWRDRSSSRRQFLRELKGALPDEQVSKSEPPWNVDHAAAQMGMMSERFVRACSEATIAMVRGLEIDAIVDFWNPFAAIAARTTKLPLVSVIQADAHPRSRGFRWWMEPPSDVPSPVATVNKVLASFGLRPVGSVADLAVGDLTLVVGSPLTDPLPADVDAVYVGPILWQPSGGPLPDWVEHLGRHRPLLWIYAGNPRYGRRKDGPMDSAVVVRAAVEAVATLDVDAVVTTGSHPFPVHARSVPANVHVTDYLPGLAMANHCDLLVHHGGYGSCQTGLVAATPAVIVPTFSERESNARRLQTLGAAAIVPVNRSDGRSFVDVDELRSVIRATLDDPEKRESSRLLSEHLEGFGGATMAADLITEFVQRSTDEPMAR